MKIYFLKSAETSLADDSSVLAAIRSHLIGEFGHSEASNPAKADAIVIHEKYSFKEWRYVRVLMSDPIIGRYPHKVFTINTDDCATGLLRGIYTSLPKKRFDRALYRIVPFESFPNELVVKRRGEPRPEPTYLATWRGNTKSNVKRRKELLEVCGRSLAFKVEGSDSWLNHGTDEKAYYVDLLLSGMFALCPGGWAAATFRIYESMALGVAPVIIADQFVAPDGPDWGDVSIRIPEDEISKIEATLRGRESEYKEIGERARSAWERYFRPDIVMKYYSQALLECIGASLGKSSAEQEIRRWNSYSTYWKNGWTLPQRVRRKVQHVFRKG